MTWYASEIFIKPNESALKFLKTDSILGDASYHLPSKLEYSINGSEGIYELGADGLYVIQPVCNPEDHCAEWFGKDIVSWNLFAARERIISPIDLCMVNSEIEPERLPPVNFLSYMKSLSKKLETDIVYFFSFMWGGTTEIEYAWFFGNKEEAYLLREPDVISTVDHLKLGEKVKRIEVDILTESINYLGGNMTSPFCFFHTRGFSWTNYKL